MVIKIEKMNNRLELSKLRIGDIIPDWSIELISDEILPKIDNFLGKPLLILFFSLGCPGCMGRAVPYANRVVYENGAKINVVGIHTNFEGIEVSLEKFKSAKEEHYFRFPFYKDYNYDTTFLAYRLVSFPSADMRPPFLLVLPALMECCPTLCCSVSDSSSSPLAG